LAARSAAQAKLLYTESVGAAESESAPIVLDDDLRDLAHFEVKVGTITIEL
jgi:hypothetical protein